LEFHKIRTGKKKFGDKSQNYRSDSTSRSFRNSRSDRGGQSTTVTCADCGNECQVPFVPTTDKPVYCNDCFRQNKPQDDRGSRYSRDDRGSRYSRDDRGSRYSRDDRGSRYSRDETEVQDIPEMTEVQDIPEMTEVQNDFLQNVIIVVMIVIFPSNQNLIDQYIAVNVLQKQSSKKKNMKKMIGQEMIVV
jgi:CxxC-x17-CxxC domain-containing protein